MPFPSVGHCMFHITSMLIYDSYDAGFSAQCQNRWLFHSIRTKCLIILHITLFHVQSLGPYWGNQHSQIDPMNWYVQRSSRICLLKSQTKVKMIQSVSCLVSNEKQGALAIISHHCKQSSLLQQCLLKTNYQLLRLSPFQ